MNKIYLEKIEGSEQAQPGLKQYVIQRSKLYEWKFINQFLLLGTESAGWYPDESDASILTKSEGEELIKICILTGANKKWSYKLKERGKS